MIDPDVFKDFCQDLDVVEQTCYCVVSLKTLGQSEIRIEVLRSLLTGDYRAHVYIKIYQRLSLDRQTAPEDFGFDVSKRREPRYDLQEDCGFWVSLKDFPWTTGKTADQALRSALSFLRERSNTP